MNTWLLMRVENGFIRGVEMRLPAGNMQERLAVTQAEVECKTHHAAGALFTPRGRFVCMFDRCGHRLNGRGEVT